MSVMALGIYQHNVRISVKDPGRVKKKICKKIFKQHEHYYLKVQIMFCIIRFLHVYHLIVLYHMKYTKNFTSRKYNLKTRFFKLFSFQKSLCKLQGFIKNKKNAILILLVVIIPWYHTLSIPIPMFNVPF